MGRVVGSDKLGTMPRDESSTHPDAPGGAEALVQGLTGLRPGDILRRTASGARRRANWLQLVKFGAVGGTGYVINLVVFALLAKGLGLHHLLAAVGAFCVAVSNNFFWNRRWTFGAHEGRATFQAPRFFAVSCGALLINLAALQFFVTVFGMDALPAQALAVAFAMPFNFIANKVWTFSWETLEQE
jgi:putative flippase GtrA